MKRSSRQAQMRTLLEAYESSGQSKQAFCESKGIKESCFYYWQRKLWDLEKEERTIPEGFQQLLPRADYEIKLRVGSGDWLALRSECLETLSELVLKMSKSHHA